LSVIQYARFLIPISNARILVIYFLKEKLFKWRNIDLSNGLNLQDICKIWMV
jgi:hypothetical protein